MRIIKFIYRLWPGRIRSITARAPVPRIKAKCVYTMEQAIFSGLCPIFALRYRSLRSFYLENKNNPITMKNFDKGIVIKDIPVDDDIGYCLQTVSTKIFNDLLMDFLQTL